MPVAGFRKGRGAGAANRRLPALLARFTRPRILAVMAVLCLGLWTSLLATPIRTRLWGAPDASPKAAPAWREAPGSPSPAEPRPAPAPQPAVAHDASLPPPPPVVSWPVPALGAAETAEEADIIQADMEQEVAGVTMPPHSLETAVAGHAVALLKETGRKIEASQLVVVVDRNPAVERLYLMLARPGGPGTWRALGSVHVSTGQAGRKDYYITPVGVFAHTGAILDFRAQGTYNEHHVRGLGLAGMRVWDFGWQWALKGWHSDGEGGDIRLQMHATDPDLLERRLGRPASEGCVRLSSSMNRFMDLHGVLDTDYEHEAAQDVRYRALLSPDRTPTPLAGRLLIVFDSSDPPGTPPTATLRPPNWPAPTVTASAAP